MEKIPLKRKGTASAAENNSIYLILPSYAEKHKNTIKQIIAKEKEKLCRDSYFNNIFSSVNFNIAFTTDRNVKNLIVRTKKWFCISGVYLYKLEGYYCDHGNKLMRRIL